MANDNQSRHDERIRLGQEALDRSRKIRENQSSGSHLTSQEASSSTLHNIPQQNADPFAPDSPYDLEAFEGTLKRGQEALERSQNLREARSHDSPVVSEGIREDLRRQNAERFALNQKIRSDIHDVFMTAMGGGLEKPNDPGIPSSTPSPTTEAPIAAESIDVAGGRALGDKPQPGVSQGANTPDIINADFDALLEFAESKFHAWHLRVLRPERDRRMADLHKQSLTSAGRAVSAIEIYREVLEREVRERIGFYAAVARQRGISEMLSKRRLEAHRKRIMTTVEHATRALRDHIERDARAAGDLSEAALPSDHRYTQVESEILDVVNTELRVLEAEGKLANQVETARASGTRECRSQRKKRGPYSARDHRVFGLVGQQILKVLTNDEIKKRFRPKLREIWGSKNDPSANALRSCLNRIRRHHNFPRSEAIPKKAVNK